MTTLDSILAGKYPAKAHARRVAERLQASGYGRRGVIYLEAQKTRLIEDNDEAMPFRQRRPFFYLSGCPLPDSYLIYNIGSDELTLFIPPIDPENVIWSGLPMSVAEALRLYDVDNVMLTPEVNATLASIASGDGGKAVAFAITGQISEEIKLQGFFETNTSILNGVIGDTRVVKDGYEIALLRKANDISAKAHIAAIKASQTAVNEREIEAAFIAACIANGARDQAYHPIVACGQNGATLHYGGNDADLADPVTKQKKPSVLIDAGAEYRTYCADITRVFPLGGKFTLEARQVYQIVLQMQMETIAMLKEGVQWEDVHTHAHRVAIQGLRKLGILRGPEDELFDKRISVAFFPHGLGHYLGMDTHDTGGNPNYGDNDSMFKYLRVRGCLPAGSVITVEPGIYFCRFIIKPFLESHETSKYIDTEVLERYWNVGGVRIEDNVHITKHGYENLTTAPKAFEEVEVLASSRSTHA
ncbi:putative Xaa-Pro aminopeptidase pepP [Aspergillus heteromorphus CBS 117.55]|uniref:Probable Xaa-Pro aminopeptidase PEPP n=1 Tax=Aspergillus heteromorphus CBS 117.55 TaxID=1448321 RepID=A0A317UQQ7_9EURO|nr:putative Xaa-Pro aminopeptidase pepP [Aspergillus heteromorphus CBS 117.55]PWY63905.1 putative Xaa-Pro aminopeptidase pepP [Aspergillus heteromorphus CBS 117.55]